ncbi:hypothetical protein ACU8YC_25485, partial [Citrobacter sp. VF227]
ISLILFTVLALAPGDPFGELASNPNVPPEVRAALRVKFGLDDPILTRYLHWLTAMLQGDWGFSFASRVNVDTLEHLMTMVSELVLTRNQLLEIARRHEDSSYKVPLQRLSHVTAELQEGVMKTRMQPIGNAWQKLPRVVRDLSAELGKQIDLVMVGNETELDRQVLEVIKDPLTHMVRNSADHGLESTAERVAAGKPARGTIRLAAYHEGGTI